jgi:hypothetical protein
MATCPSGHQSASDDFCDVCGTPIGAAAAFAAGADGPVPDTAPDAAAYPAAPATGETCPHCATPRTGQFCEACGYAYPAGTASADPGPPATQAPAPVSAPVPMPAAPAPPVTPTPLVTPVTPAPQAVPPASAPAATPAPAQPAAVAAPVTSIWTAVVAADRDYYETVRAAGGPDTDAITFPAYCPERRFRLSGKEVRVGRRSVSRGIDPEIDLTGPPADPGVSRLHAVLVAAPDGTWSIVDPGSENGTLLNGTEIPRGTPVPVHDGDRIHLGAWTALTITTR